MSSWWAVARSEEVDASKPLSVDLGDRPIVMWRDLSGTVRALEDRCPHRRAPLSLGCIRKEGWIQCGYHGWSYDGETGRVKEIPNLKNETRFPPLYRAERYAVHEIGGFVRIALDVNAVASPTTAVHLPLCGTTHVALDHDRYLAALLDDPGLLLSIRGVHFTTYLMAELREQDGRLVMERSCQWKWPHWPAPFSSEYPVTLLTSSDPVTGEFELLLRDRELRPLLTAILAPVPAARGVTAVRWRAKLGERVPRLAVPVLSRLAPVKVHEFIDAARLRKLKPSVSVTFEDLRHKIHSSESQVVA